MFAMRAIKVEFINKDIILKKLSTIAIICSGALQTVNAGLIDVEFTNVRFNNSANVVAYPLAGQIPDGETQSVTYNSNTIAAPSSASTTINAELGYSDVNYGSMYAIPRCCSREELADRSTESVSSSSIPSIDDPSSFSSIASAETSGSYSLTQTAGGQGAVFRYEGNIDGFTNLFSLTNGWQQISEDHWQKTIWHQTSQTVRTNANVDTWLNITDRESGELVETSFSANIQFLQDDSAKSGSHDDGYYFQDQRSQYVVVKTDGGSITSALRDGVELAENTPQSFLAERSRNDLVRNASDTRSTYKVEGTAERLNLAAGIHAQIAMSDDLPMNIHDSVIATLVIGQGASQDNPFMPDESDDETAVYTFKNAVSGGWFDPILYENYFFSMDSIGTTFTDILSFPVGFVTEFGLIAFDTDYNLFDLGNFLLTDSVDFESLLGFGASHFLVTGIDDTDGIHNFPLQLGFSSLFADFTMQGIEDADLFLSQFAQTNFDNPTNVSAPYHLGLFCLMLACWGYRSHRKLKAL